MGTFKPLHDNISPLPPFQALCLAALALAGGGQNAQGLFGANHEESVISNVLVVLACHASRIEDYHDKDELGDLPARLS